MLNQITATCKYVMKNSSYVKINFQELDEFISKIDCNNLKNWLLFNPYNILELDIEILINFLLIFEAIDYSFWGEPKWTIQTTTEGSKDGSDALMYAMLKYVKENNSTDFSNISLDEFGEVLKGNITIPLLKERYKTLVEISNIVNNKMNGSFYKYIKDVSNDIELFDIIINNFDSFKDEREHNGRTIYFYKLAQLLTSDILHVREKKEKIKVDYSHLIGCADYKIPQTLRALNIIKYNEELANIVDSKEKIEMSSKYEVEIRSSQIVILDYIKEKIKDVNSIDINDFLFLYSKQVKNRVKPYHLCRNINY